ncbi:MAG: enolase C-terminal domain-like protein [Thermodesulfobacteriota bacterium]|nr:enolase C-terminal domain-like protein [Thermodesulfobacteriota bacterium]
MRIKQIVLYENRRPFAFRFKSPHKDWTGARSIVMAIGFDNGLFGWGESTPRPYVTGEDCNSVLSVLKTRTAARLIETELNAGHTARDIRAITDDVGADSASPHIPINAALGAVDLALLDALGRLNRMSVAALLGPPQRSEITYSTTLLILPPEAVKTHFSVVFNYPFGHFKIALSGDPSADMARIRMLQSLTRYAEYGLEGNGKLSRQQLETLLQEMPVETFTFFEQPLAPSASADLKHIRPKIPIPVVADESACCLQDAEGIVDSGLFDRINIKISKCGGLLRSLEMAEFAVANGLSCHLGTHVGESRILEAAGVCFAIAAPGLLLMETGSSLLFGQPPLFLPGSVDRQSAGNNVDQGPGTAPGLGIEMTPEAAEGLFGPPAAVIK